MHLLGLESQEAFREVELDRGSSSSSWDIFLSVLHQTIFDQFLSGVVSQGPVDGDVLDHVGFLPESPAADLAAEGLLPRVDLEVLLEVEALAVDEEAAHRAALVAAPVVVHVLREGEI